jgi:hypothetical protein
MAGLGRLAEVLQVGQFDEILQGAQVHGGTILMFNGIVINYRH